MKFWKYTDKSNPSVPNRDIVWFLRLPYIFKFSVALGWKTGFYTLRILFLNFHFNHGAYCGKECRFNIDKWIFGFIVSNGWLFSANIGISYTDYLQWEVERMLIKRMILKECAELRAKTEK